MESPTPMGRIFVTGVKVRYVPDEVREGMIYGEEGFVGDGRSEWTNGEPMVEVCWGRLRGGTLEFESDLEVVR